MTATVAAVSSANGTSNYTITLPSGTTNGDLLIGIVASDWNTLANNNLPLASWTALTTSDYDGGTNAMHVAINYRIASSEPANYTVSIGGGADSAAAILRVTGHDGTPVIVQVAPTVVSAGTGAINAPSLTPSGADDLLICIGAVDGANGGGALTWSDTAGGLTEHVDRQSTTWTSLKVGSLANPSSPSGAKTLTPTSPTSHNNGAACTISIKSTASGATVFGTASATFGALTASASGVPTVTATVSATFGALLASASGVPTVTGTATAPMGALSATASGTPTVRGAAAASFGALAASATGGLLLNGTAAAPFGGLTASASGSTATTGTAAAPLGGLSAAAAGSVSVAGQAATTFGALVASATGSGIGSDTGAAVAMLGALTAAATGAVTVTASGTASFGALTATAAGILTVSATATAMLGVLLANASGTGTILATATANFGALLGAAIVYADLVSVMSAGGRVVSVWGGGEPAATWKGGSPGALWKGRGVGFIWRGDL